VSLLLLLLLLQVIQLTCRGHRHLLILQVLLICTHAYLSRLKLSLAGQEEWGAQLAGSSSSRWSRWASGARSAAGALSEELCSCLQLIRSSLQPSIHES